MNEFDEFGENLVDIFKFIHGRAAELRSVSDQAASADQAGQPAPEEVDEGKNEVQNEQAA